jgi:aryl-alcohol dehydrogenase-like predicted oxidoreductase
MTYTTLGRSGLKVSRLCLGTMNFGEGTDEKTAHRILDLAVDAGVTFVDTANVYGGSETERIIGRWMAQGGGRREKIVLATKVYGQIDDTDPGNNTKGLSAYRVRRNLEASLGRLGTDHVELYQMHHVDRGVSWDELWEVFGSLVQAGKTDYVGSSNFAGWHLAVAQGEAKARGMLGLVSEQHLYNLLVRQAELEVLPSAKHLGLGVLPWSPLSGGLLSSAALAGGGVRSSSSPGRLDRHRAQLESYAKLCRELNEREDVVALAWLLCNPAVTAPVIGPRTAEQMSHALRALDVTLDTGALKRLDVIFPGPGGSAPEAYAW